MPIKLKRPKLKGPKLKRNRRLRKITGIKFHGRQSQNWMGPQKKLKIKKIK